jgi:hypothetical protein
VPKDASVDLSARNGQIDVRGVTGTIVAHTTNGPIALENCGGDVRASAENGPIATSGGGAGTAHDDQRADRAGADGEILGRGGADRGFPERSSGPDHRLGLQDRSDRRAEGTVPPRVSGRRVPQRQAPESRRTSHPRLRREGSAHQADHRERSHRHRSSGGSKNKDVDDDDEDDDSDTF